jgi:hypothetical protein
MSKITDFFEVVKKNQDKTNQEGSPKVVSETSHEEEPRFSETAEEMPLQYSPLEKMLMEKVQEMRKEREELFAMIKELKDELSLIRKDREKKTVQKTPTDQDGWTKVTRGKTSQESSKGPTTFASVVKKTTPRYKPVNKRPPKAQNKVLQTICTKRNTPAIEVGVIYFVIQNTKPFIKASQNRDYQSQRYLMNGICRRFGITKWVLNKTMIGNGTMQLFVNKDYEGAVAEAIETRGGEYKFDTEFAAGQVPEFLVKRSQRERAKKNLINRAERLYNHAPTRNCRRAVLEAYEGPHLVEIKEQILRYREKIQPAEEGYRWTFIGNDLVESVTVEDPPTRWDNEESGNKRAKRHAEEEANVTYCADEAPRL